jgi:hypothetical protein
MAIYSKIVANASRGATAGTFDTVGTISLRSDAQRLLGLLLEAGLATNTAAEAYSGVTRISSADLGISNMTYSCPPYLGGAPATNIGYSVANTEFLPFNWATKGKENILVEYSSNLPDPTGAASVVAAMVYSGGPKPTTSTDMEFMPLMNPLIGKGAVTTSTAAVNAVSTAGTDATIPAWAKRIIGMKQYIIPNLFTAGEERVGYCTYRSTVPDWDPQEWPFAAAINAPLGTAVGKGLEIQAPIAMATSFPLTGKNETISTTIVLNVAVTTGDQVVYEQLFA